MNTAWIFLAGEHLPDIMPMPQKGEIIIAVDGGLRHCRQLNLKVDYWIGDGDSSQGIYYPAQAFYRYPCDKDQTDFELALDFLKDKNIALAHIIGADGEEADHCFANLWVAPQASFALFFWQRKGHIVQMNQNYRLKLYAKEKVPLSIFALTPLKALKSQGLYWELKDLDLLPYSAHGTRNRLNGETAELEWQYGEALIFYNGKMVVEEKR